MAGVKYNVTSAQPLHEYWRVETLFRCSVGSKLDTSRLTNGSFLQVATPLFVDKKSNIAYPVINVKVMEAVTAEATEIKIHKGSLAFNGMTLGDGKAGALVSMITRGADFDTLTLDKAGITAKVGDILFEASKADGKAPKYVANRLNYALTEVKDGATITAVAQAYEVNEEVITTPISDKDKEGLTSRFLF